MEKYVIPEKNSLDSMEEIESEKDFVPILNKERFNRPPVFSKEILDIIASDPMWIDDDNKTKTIAEKTKGAVKASDISIHPLFPRLKLGSTMYSNSYHYYNRSNKDFIEWLKRDGEFINESEKERIFSTLGPFGHGLAGVEDLVNNCDERSSFIDVSVYKNYEDSLILNFLNRFSGVIYITKGFVVRALDLHGEEKIPAPDEFKAMIVNIFEKHFENVSLFGYILAKNPKLDIAEFEKEFRNYIGGDKDIICFSHSYETLSSIHYADEERRWRNSSQEWNARLDILQKTKHFADKLNQFLLSKLKT